MPLSPVFCTILRTGRAVQLLIRVKANLLQPLKVGQSHFFFVCMTGNSSVNQLKTMVEEALSETEFELVLMEYQKAGQEMVLRLFIDHPEGVQLGHCQTVTNMVLDLLEEKDPIGGDYRLEVSSPGVDRPLVKLADYQRFLQERVFVKTHKAIDGVKKFTGTLTMCGEDEIEVLTEQEGRTFRIPFDLIAKATLKPILEF